MTEPAAWVTVRVVPGAGRDRVAAALFDAGAQGLQEVGEALVTHVPDQSAADALVCAALAASPDAHVETSPLPAVDWTEKWKESIRVHELGRLTVAPPWLADGLDPARTIVIEPLALGGQAVAGFQLATDQLGADRIADLLEDPAGFDGTESFFARPGLLVIISR